MSGKHVLRFLVRYAMVITFIGMIVLFSAATIVSDSADPMKNVPFPGRFGGSDNLLNILNQNFTYIILAVGMTVVIISGGIDLCVGSLLALCGVVTTSLMMHGGFGRDPSIVRILPMLSLPAMMAIGIAAGAGTGALVGGYNGLLVTVFRLPPFIATLSFLLIARGLAYMACSAYPVSNLPDEFVWMGRAKIFTFVPFPIVLALGIAVLVHLLLSRTRFGRYVYAVGGNEEAARLSGIRVGRVKFIVYTLNGALCAICGILLAARLTSGDPSVGQMYELNAITAVVLGGASLNGGRGSIAGTIFGAVFVGVLDNGLGLLNVQEFPQMMVKGFVLQVAVLLDQLKARMT